MNNAKTNTVAVIETLAGRQMMSATVPAVEAAVVMSLTNTANATASAAYGLKATQKHRTEQITSTFENSMTEIQYAFFPESARSSTATPSRFPPETSTTPTTPATPTTPVATGTISGRVFIDENGRPSEQRRLRQRRPQRVH